MDNTASYDLKNKKALREVIVKIRLKRIDIQERITVEVLLDSGVIGLVMSSEFTKKQGFKLKRLDKSIYMRNMNSSLNKKGPIEYMVEVNIYYQEHRERTEINVIGEQKWTVILRMPWLAHHNPEINWRTGEVKITRCLEEYRKQWRPKQGKLGWQKQKEEETKEETGKKQKEKAEQKEKKQEKEKTINVKRVIEEWEI